MSPVWSVNPRNPHQYELHPPNDSKLSEGLYGRKYCTIFGDEFHDVRTLNKKWLAFRALRDRASAVVGLTATPLMNTPAVSVYLYCFTALAISY